MTLIFGAKSYKKIYFAPYFMEVDLKIGPERDFSSKFFARNPEIDISNIKNDFHLLSMRASSNGCELPKAATFSL